MFFQIAPVLPRTGPAINPGSWMLDSLLPGLFIVMTHTSQHQVPRRAQISYVEMRSKPQGASKLNRYPPPVESFFLALNVQTSLMHI